MSEFVTVASYNIEHGESCRFDWGKLASHIIECSADLVGLQEIDIGTMRIGGQDTMAELRHATGIQYSAFIPTMNYDGGRYGTAILSRFPIKSFEVINLPSQNYEPRSCGYALITYESRDIHFINTHLCYESSNSRAEQFAELARLIPYGHRYLVTGDFNTSDIAEFNPILKDDAKTVNLSDDGVVYNTFRQPPAAIDNVIYSSNYFKVIERGMIDSDDSDHNLLFCRFQVMHQ